MVNKTYHFNLNELAVRVEADAEGADRYMVRIDVGKGRVRIGYLTGSNRTWLAEFFGSRPSVPAGSAKAACLALASWAITQPNIAGA